MVSESDLKEIEKIAAEFFEKMGFEVGLEIPFQKEETVFLNLKTPEAGVLIGEGGQTLFELQHLIRAILKKKIKENFYFDFDINDYKKKKTEYLKELARSSADEAAMNRLEKELPAMTPSERRIVHLELAGRQDVKTESVGLEPQRRIIIRPCP